MAAHFYCNFPTKNDVHSERSFNFAIVAQTGLVDKIYQTVSASHIQGVSYNLQIILDYVPWMKCVDFRFTRLKLTILFSDLMKNSSVF